MACAVICTQMQTCGTITQERWIEQTVVYNAPEFVDEISV